jgi:protein-tyrosine-phosphatase
MAEGYFRSLVENEGLSHIQVSSAGTYAADGDPPNYNSVQTLKKYGIDISHQRSSRLSEELIENADLIVAMSESHRSFVAQVQPSAIKKSALLGDYSGSGEDIADPFGGNLEVYNYCFTTMKPALDNLFEKVIDSELKV